MMNNTPDEGDRQKTAAIIRPSGDDNNPRDKAIYSTKDRAEETCPTTYFTDITYFLTDPDSSRRKITDDAPFAEPKVQEEGLVKLVEDFYPPELVDLIVQQDMKGLFGIKEVKHIDDPSKQGGSGRTYTGIESGEKKFIKALLKGDARKMIEEGRLQKYLHDTTGVVPDVIHLANIDIKDRTLPVVVMEIAKGYQLLEYGRGYSTTNELLWHLKRFKSVVDSVAKIHAAGYVHKDLKPENIFVDTDLKATIIDFGISSRIGEEQPNGIVSGTVEYMAPEQQTAVPAHTSMDIYSLGCILYEQLTGQVPIKDFENKYKDGSMDALQYFVAAFNAKVNEQPFNMYKEVTKRQLHRIDSDLREIMYNSMRSDPKERYQNCSALSNAIGNVINRIEYSENLSARMRKAAAEGRKNKTVKNYARPEEGIILDMILEHSKMGPP